MKTYNLNIRIGQEKEAFRIMKEHGEIITVGGGVPVSPMFANWKGSETGAERLKAFTSSMIEMKNK